MYVQLRELSQLFQWYHKCLVWAFKGSVVDVIMPLCSAALICKGNLHSFFLWAMTVATCVVHVQWIVIYIYCIVSKYTNNKLSVPVRAHSV